MLHWAGKMAELVKVLAAKAGSLSSIPRTQMMEGENRLSLDLYSYAVTISKCGKLKEKVPYRMNCRTLYCHHEGKLLDHAAKNVFKSLKAVVSSLCHPHVTLECLHSCASYKYLGSWGFWCFLFCCAWPWTQPELCWASAEPLSYILSSFVYSFVCYFLEIVWVVQTSLEHSVAQGIFKFLILLPRPPKITACAIGPGILFIVVLFC